MNSISIDPGTRNLGWAFWVGNTLIACGLSRSSAPGLAERAADHVLAIRNDTSPWQVDRVVVEHMEAGNERVPPQDLIEVEAVGCLVAGDLCSRVFGHTAQARLLPPSTWKSSLPKGVIHERNRALLSAGERLILDAACAKAPAANRKEILDAVAIGLFDLQRVSRAGCARR